MPTIKPVPTLRRRRLGGRLRDLRNQAGHSLETAAAAMGWDPTKLSRIENAKAQIKPTEIGTLLASYGVRDQELTAALEGLARDAGKRGWWQTYGNVMAQVYKDHISLEDDAETTRIYASNLIPGLLQTGAYAREIIAATALTRSPEEVVALAEVRKTRQAILTRPQGPLNLWAVIHESALHYRSAAHPPLMREQLRHLLEMADLPNITIQIMPLDATAHPGMLGLFEVVRFPHPWPTVVFLENLRGGYFVEADDDVKVFETAFDRVLAAALPVDDSRETIKRAMEGSTP
ncbi:helix-turn-helix domain-containing protein [Streptomyces alkaliphilus]|uniref:Helix-turn-helix domain-containing protein n=1 Tax=Streptomyces alkaliphilus TaxID=1472722 RepID=A0A7W3Y168_9ACTN|nr:helix-turn-helix transcriptional regulator [Streptomyces alkaliphilus]MBB0244031.1 helix-turn-helix domain-containing protein [Streptomyces alkaliphilus]